MTKDGEGIHHPAMHFPLVKSNGGPYDDDAFAAGWNLATLDMKLVLARANNMYLGGVLLHGDLFPQIDLIAMRHGYLVDAEPFEDDEEYSWFFFTTPKDID